MKPDEVIGQSVYFDAAYKRHRYKIRKAREAAEKVHIIKAPLKTVTGVCLTYCGRMVDIGKHAVGLRDHATCRECRKNEAKFKEETNGSQTVRNNGAGMDKDQTPGERSR